MRRVIVTLLICVFALGMNAQDMTSVFTAMPDQYIPQLEHAWRKDLVDLYTSGKESRLKNTMNGFSTLQKLTNDYLLLQTTERHGRDEITSLGKQYLRGLYDLYGKRPGSG